MNTYLMRAFTLYWSKQVLKMASVFWWIHLHFVILHCDLKRNGALLGSTSARNKAAE